LADRSSADYGLLNGIASHRTNTKLIEENWDDMLRLAGSLKLGTVQATSIMKTLRIDDHPTKLAQAVAELGRIDKTIHALTYIDEQTQADPDAIGSSGKSVGGFSLV